MTLVNLTGLLRRRSAGAPVPRQQLVFIRLPMPRLARRQLLDAMRLQLTQYMPAGPFGFVCRRQAGDYILAWCWSLGDALISPLRGGDWPEPATDEAQPDGLYLLRRCSGFEAQQWLLGELRHSRWFATMPDAEEWQRYARGCGVDPQAHTLPEAATLPKSAPQAARAWLAGDNLPVPDRWAGWHWQAALLLLVTVASVGVGVHMQTREQIRVDSQRLAALRSGRESALQERAHYEQIAAELDGLRALTPRLSQLELLDRFISSGIFTPSPAAAAAAKPTPSSPGLAPGGLPPGFPGSATTVATEPARAQLVEWDFRGDQLKLTLELPERELTLLDITRRVEKVPGLGALRVGQDSVGNTLSLSTTVSEATR